MKYLCDLKLFDTYHKSVKYLTDKGRESDILTGISEVNENKLKDILNPGSLSEKILLDELLEDCKNLLHNFIAVSQKLATTSVAIKKMEDKISVIEKNKNIKETVSTLKSINSNIINQIPSIFENMTYFVDFVDTLKKNKK